MTHPVDPEGRAARFIALQLHEATHDRLVWGMRQNRDRAVAGVPEWEELRALASQIKEHTLTHLDQYLEQFEANATRLGTQCCEECRWIRCRSRSTSRPSSSASAMTTSCERMPSRASTHRRR